MKHTNRPLIIGGSHHNTFSLVRCFGEAGMKVDVILYECKDSYIGYSKYVDQLWYCVDAEDTVAKVAELVGNNPLLYVIITATDVVASLMDLCYDEFKDKCYFFNAGQTGLVTHFMDKETQTEVALNVGLNVPKTRSFSKDEQLTFDIYPCIVKPLASIDGGKRLAICNNQKELMSHAAKFADVDKVLVQQFIEKDDEIVLLGVSAKGEVLIPGYIKKYRDVMGGTTYSSTAPINDIDAQLVAKAKQMVMAMHYDGLFGIEFIRSRNGYFFIEINLRNDATSYSLAVAGVNLPLMYYQAMFEDKPLTTESSTVRRIYSMVEMMDFRNVLHRKVGLMRWLKQRKGAECRYMYSKEDKEPYRMAKKEFLKSLVLKLLP